MLAFRTLVALVALAAGLQSTGAQTPQDWPNRPVRLIVPFAAGGSTDVAAAYDVNKQNKSVQKDAGQRHQMVAPSSPMSSGLSSAPREVDCAMACN